MDSYQELCDLLREYVHEVKKRSKNHRGDHWMQGTDDTLMLDEPGTLVPADARSKISHFLKAMGLMK